MVWATPSRVMGVASVAALLSLMLLGSPKATVGTTPAAGSAAGVSIGSTPDPPSPLLGYPAGGPTHSTATESTAPRPGRTAPRPGPTLLVAADGLGLPLQVFQAYRRSADAERAADASCHLPWWLLAGIGHTESGNAEGGRIYSDGTTRGRILGPRLDGSIPGDAIVHDTDHGVLDGDRVFDRAVGPMQFIPSTWRVWGTDGNADGKADPNNVYDATLAAARYLCADDRDLATSAGMRAAILSYNHSSAYLATVLAWGHAYRDGAVTVFDSTLPVVSDVTRVRPPLSSRPPTRHHQTAVRPRTTTSSGNGVQSPTVSASASGPSGPPPAGPTAAGPTPTECPSSTSPSPVPSDSSNPSPAPSDQTSGDPTPTGSGSTTAAAVSTTTPSTPTTSEPPCRR
jgi:transglycosylase-like protein with SLT domain